MASRYMSADMRRRVLDHARTIIDCPQERQREEAAREAFQLAVVHAVESAVGSEDMAVLRQHGCTRVVSDFNFIRRAPEGSTEMPGEPIEVSVLPRDYTGPRYQRRRSRIRSDGEGAPEGVELPLSWWAYGGILPGVHHANARPYALALWEAIEAHDEARRLVLEELRRTLQRLRTVEAVLKAWPHAAAVLPPLQAKDDQPTGVDLSKVAIKEEVPGPAGPQVEESA